ncbi:DUF4870 domain-containing protein [Acidithiobacillus acidisediminis]|jgi:hypothetical protein|uniref:DUF4870 domain-containing protein n=1 Tax=Acidithiobacillus TaxID=119977 RepID=UPI002010BFC1|nr:DUF4870 domain-containing protein [Acidithiobacillus sp. S30A2]
MSDSSVVVPETSNEDRNTATLVHAGGILFGFLPSLIVYLLKKDQAGPWLMEQLREALNFQITMLIAYVAATILSSLLIGLVLFPILFFVDLIFCILAAVKTSSGGSYRYPLSIRLVN